MQTILFIIIGLVVGATIAYLYAKAKIQQAQSRTEIETNKTQQLQTALQELKTLQNQANTTIGQLGDELTALKTRCATLTADKQNLENRIDRQVQAHQQAQTELNTTWQQRLDEEREQHRQQLEKMREDQKEQLAQHEKLIREQINTVSEKVLKQRAEELQLTNRDQLANILNPLNDSLKQMKEAVEKSDREQTSTMERLDASIKANLKQAQEVGERADKLANALTSENKTQGNFGELRLRTLLENMGLEEGVQYEEQTAIKVDGSAVKGEDGRRLIPDVILHFPDNRDVIIDSKMSLTAFQDYHNAETDAQRAEALTRHIASMRQHVKELSQKKYQEYGGKTRNKLDFVMMYVFSESALQLALTNDTTLWKDAYNSGVVITGSQNLYMTLRVLEMTWRQVRQAENQDNIMKAADEVVNRVQMFYERLKTTRDQLEKTSKAFNDLENITRDSGKSITTAARNLLKYGAKENPKRTMHLPDDNDIEALPE